MEKSENAENVVVKIYELRDPRDLECKPRYVGITTTSLKRRLGIHLQKHRLKNNTHKNNWIKSLLKDGIKPLPVLIEEVVGWKYACEVEKYWIKEFKEQGYKLVNSTEGGDGSQGYKWTPEVREKCMNHLRIRFTDEYRLKLSIAHTGKKMSNRCRELLILRNNKPVIIIDVNENFTEYPSVKECASALGVSRSIITRGIKTGVIAYLNLKIKLKPKDKHESKYE